MACLRRPDERQDQVGVNQVLGLLQHLGTLESLEELVVSLLQVLECCPLGMEVVQEESELLLEQLQQVR